MPETLNLVVKTDTHGALEAMKHSCLGINHPDLELHLVRTGIGTITKSDVDFAIAAKATIVGFNVKADKRAAALAKQHGIDIRSHKVIYKAVEDIKRVAETLLPPETIEHILGKAAVRATFHVPKVGTVAGCAVLQGKVARGARAKLVRNGKVITTSDIDSLRNVNKNVPEVSRGRECGIHLRKVKDVRQGDLIECFEEVSVPQQVR